ncbi:hypothetical protein BST61_g9793 [Cercospora zeina]
MGDLTEKATKSKKKLEQGYRDNRVDMASMSCGQQSKEPCRRQAMGKGHEKLQNSDQAHMSPLAAIRKRLARELHVTSCVQECTACLSR